MSNIKIDYIIPTYYDSSIVKVGLDALCKQTMKDCLRVIIVNDCSPNTNCNYQDILDEYKDKLDITIVKTPYNSGPGMAMQYGIDTGTSDYYLIQDDDDCIASDDVIESYIKIIEEHIDEDNIISIMGDSALCDKDYNIINVFEEKTIVHARMFSRRFMESKGIRYVDEVSWWADDYYLNTLTMLELKNNYVNINLDKVCYLYRPGLDGSVTRKMTAYEMLCRDIIVDVEIRKFLDRKHGIDANINVYKNINKKLFNIIFSILHRHCQHSIIRKREWNILTNYRKYLLSIIKDIDGCSYKSDGGMFENYRLFVLGVADSHEYKDIDIQSDDIEDMYYTYLSNEKTIFNCSYEELDTMLKEK